MKKDPGMKAPIANKRGEGYYYTNNKFRLQAPTFSNEDVKSIHQALSLLKNFSQLGLPASFASAVNKLNLVIADPDENSIVLLDHNDSYRGARHLETLFNAIKDAQAIKFRYKKFDAEEGPQADLIRSPLVLKEYQRMWYVLMYNPENDTYRNYALDRMNFVVIEPNAKYTKPKGFSSKKYYQYAMGITVDNNRKPDLIKLKVFKPLLHYIIESPWHETQQVEYIDSDAAIVTLKVYAGSELMKEIMSWGPSVQVLEPKSLRVKILDQVKNLRELYR
jgi:predicted DNA-binding transcriptional regulator YafY